MTGYTVMVVMRSRLCLDHLRQQLPNCQNVDYPEYEVIGFFDVLDENTLTHLARLRPSVVLIDVGSSQSLGDIMEVRGVTTDSRIVAAEVRLDKNLIAEIAAVGVSGYVRQGGCAQEISEAISGSLVNPPLVTDAYVAHELNSYLHQLSRVSEPLNSPWEIPDDGSPTSPLTRRETEVLSMIASGASNKEIARHLSLELSTIKNHVHSILAKYRVRRRSQAAARYTQSRRQSVN